MLNGHEVMDCQWCRGDGRDHAALGFLKVRDCPRCAGSGRVYVTSRKSVTGRRRVYKRPAPKPGVVAAMPQIFAPAKSAFQPSGLRIQHRPEAQGSHPASPFATCSEPMAVTTELNEVLQKPKLGNRRMKTRKKHGRHHAA